MNRLKELREEKQLSLGELSKALAKQGVKISKASLNNYERGEQNPRGNTWEILAKFFGVSSSYIMGLSNERTDETKKLLANMEKRLSEKKCIYSVHSASLESDSFYKEISYIIKQLKSDLNIDRMKYELENQYIKAFNKLNDDGKKELFNYANYLYSQQKYRSKKIDVVVNDKKITDYNHDKPEK